MLLKILIKYLYTNRIEQIIINDELLLIELFKLL